MGRKKNNNRFPIDRFQHVLKVQRDDIAKKSKLYRQKKEKLRRLEKKIANVSEKSNDSVDSTGTLQTARKRKSSKIIELSLRKKLARQKKPSKLDNNNNARLDLNVRRAHERTDETFNCAKVIHGNNQAALDGLWATIINKCTDHQLQSYINNTPRLMKKSVAPVIKKQVKTFETSLSNYNRSLKVLYSGGLISKTKYKQIRSASTFESQPKKGRKTSIQFGDGIPIPKILPYDKVIRYVNSLDIGDLNDFCHFCQDPENISGKFRDLEDLLKRMAKVYLMIDSNSEEDKQKLDWFGKGEGCFQVAIGGDGAPFGKESEATSWLVSFANIKSNIASCNDNFLLCGANCKEDCYEMIKYAHYLLKCISEIESKCYANLIEGVNITFHFELVPSDMKWLASYSGELNNAAYFFSSFANVNSDTKDLIGGSIGYSQSDTWQPWDYDTRLEVASKVSELKTKLEKSTLAKSTQRDKVLKLIRSQNSRQEQVPVIGKLVDKALAEPLHNTNNAWQYFNKQVMYLALDVSSIPKGIKDFDELPDDNVFLVYVNAIKKDLKCNLLYLKIRKWFQSGRQAAFEYRFTGKQSKLFCHNFMYLISSLNRLGPILNASFCLKLHALASIGLNLRDAVSLYTRQSMQPQQLEELQMKCKHFFNGCSLFLTSSVTPTVWTIGYAIPFHTAITIKKFNCGLGINTMQGREAKHVIIKKYAEHSLPSNRWDLVFRHEFVTTLYLREHDPHASMFKKTKISYIPDRIKDDGYCYCGHPKFTTQEQCYFCSHPVRLAITRSCENGQVDPIVYQLLVS